MKMRVKFAGGFVGASLSLGCAFAQTTPTAAPTPAPAASPAPAAAPAPVVASPAPVAQKPAAPAPTPTTAAAPAAPNPTPSAAAAPAANPTLGSAPAPVDMPVAVAPKPKRKSPPPPPLETALSTDPDPTLQPNTFFTTAKAAEHYAAIVQAGGWPTDIPALRPGSRGPAVARLRKRLEIEGDPDATGGPSYDKGLIEAVKRFQARMGLRQNGVVAGATLKAIDVPAETRHDQLVASAQRLSGQNFSFGDRYVVVNLPSTQVEAVENGKVAHHYIAIVGDPDHPSPEIAAHISVINLNPTWTVPTSIIKKEIIPKMQKDPGYLARAKIRVLDGAGNEIEPRSIDWTTNRAANYILRQDSGAGNSLGSIRIGMPNKLAVYMHDTPGKALFGRDFRFLSHGCVRVQGVWDYAAWLLEGTPGGPNGVWDKEALLNKMKDHAREDIKLTKSVPVIWVYLTGWDNGDGPASFRNDVYGVDVTAVASANANLDTGTAPGTAPDAPAAQ
jgi:murein L,D-transpeptidase YcbB/YkuD